MDFEAQILAAKKFKRPFDVLTSPVILIGAGSVLAQPFVSYALDRLNVVAMVDNARAGQEENGVTVLDDDGLRARLGQHPNEVGILCCGSERAIQHFQGVWNGNQPLISYFEAMTLLPDDFDRGSRLAILPAFSDETQIRDIHSFGQGVFHDEDSLRTLEGLLLYRLTWNMDHLLAMNRPEPDIYFEAGGLDIRDDEIFVDGGAYDGDTVRSFVSRTKGLYRHIDAFELDPVNSERLRTRTQNIPRVSVYDTGLWSHADVLGLEHRDNDGSRISDRLSDSAATAKLSALDDCIEAATLIKLDVEGAEAWALEGARKLIAAHKPKLAICAYHKPDDIIVLTDKIGSIRDDYRFRLRHYSPILFDTVIYAD